MASVDVFEAALCLVLCQATFQMAFAESSFKNKVKEQEFHALDHEKLGMKQEEYLAASDRRREFLSLVAQWRGTDVFVGEVASEGPMADDIFYTAEQYEYLIEDLKWQISNYHTDRKLLHKREKRKAGLFEHQGGFVRQWALPIHFGINPNFTHTERAMIRAAFQYYTDNTVVKFEEVAYVLQSVPVLWIEKARGCASCVGMCGDDGGGILLSPDCAIETGGTLHEIGHSIGLLHEHQRVDRDAYLRMFPENIASGRGLEDANFRTNTELESTTMGIPFDYGSLMIYQTWAGSRKPEWLPVMRPHDARYTGAIGQRVALSFFDIMAVNFMYGTACTNGTRCYNGGYRDPRDCQKCLCPEGLGGADCRDASDKSLGCSQESGTIVVASTEEQCISSRDYDSGGPYRIGDTCSFLFKTPPACEGHIRVRFDGDFGVYCYKYGVDDQCFHWVEVKYKRDPAERGIRLCCNRISSDMREVTSEGDSMVIHFDASYSVTRNVYIPSGQRRGFRFCYSLEEECKERSPPTESPQNGAEINEDKDATTPSRASLQSSSSESDTPLSTANPPMEDQTTPDAKSNATPGDNKHNDPTQPEATTHGSSTESQGYPTQGDITPGGSTSSNKPPDVNTPPTPPTDPATARTVFPTRQFTPKNNRYTACEDLCGCKFRQFVGSFLVDRVDYPKYCHEKLYFQQTPITAMAYVGEMVCNGHLEGATYLSYRFPATKRCVMFCN